MAIKKIEEIYLYIVDNPESIEKNFNALSALSKIPFQKMQYSQNANIDELLQSLNTWWNQPYAKLSPLSINSFPFVVYTEVHDDIPARWSPIKYVTGEQNIKDFVSLYESINF